MARMATSFFRGTSAFATLTVAFSLFFTLGCSSNSKTPATSADSTAVTADSPTTGQAPGGQSSENKAKDNKEKPGSGEKNWAGQMHSLSATLSELLPLVASNSKFNASANFERIETGTKNLRQLAHGISSSQKPNNDPTIKMMSGLFAEDIDRALDSLRSGNRNYARQILKDTTSYCIQCHTQTSNGPNFPKLNLSINLNELSKLEQAEFFTATRQFDRALSAYLDALKDEKLAKADPFSWEQSARSALAIIVRVKNNAKEALQLLSKIETQGSLPETMKKALVSWKASTLEWRNEKKVKPPSTEEQIKRAEALIKQAQKNQEFPLDHSQDIVYFRAASILHTYLQGHTTNNPLGAKALFLAGVVAEATRDMNFWTLHESYYEQCIRAEPHSKQAETCFEHLKESVTLGYSGSGGINIPPEVSRRLEGFREAAAPEKSNSKVQ